MNSSIERIRQVTQTLLRRQGKTLAEDIGIDVGSNNPKNLFGLLIGALLLSARIGHELAMKSTRILFERGWTTPQKMAKSTWEQRVKALDQGGYVRYDERTSTMLGETAQMVIDKYGGDLRRLREAARSEDGHPDPALERKLLKEFKGIGDVGVDIFFREAQLAWPELYPFADEKVLATAKRVGLPSRPQKLAELVHRKRDFVRLVDSLITVMLNREEKEIRAVTAPARAAG
jgi:endonuclease III